MKANNLIEEATKWKGIFDEINAGFDAMGQSEFVGFEDTEYYADQIYNISGEDEEVGGLDWDQCLEIATAMAEL